MKAKHISKKPFFIRAVYDWTLANDGVPYIAINSNHPETTIIPEHLKDSEQVVFNISPKSCKGLHISNEKVSFNARFNNTFFDVSFSVSAVNAIFDSETGEGLTFADEPIKSVKEETRNAAAKHHNKETNQPTDSHLRLLK